MSRDDLCAYCHSRAREPGRKVCSDRCDDLRKAAYARSNAKRRGTPYNAAKRKFSVITPICPRCGKRISVSQDCRCEVGQGDLPKSIRHDVVKVLNVRTMKTKIEVR